eukprot:TRINITY_DN13267_c0_g1_i4.p1 TRINITY_DN13267_c0_g1~~TRINITY_DN13267_c0_g1_i4.p1  ORF type:complete len:126 (-),score=14.01 TRINITY_DN13267_c0_g1_i4:300-677(-)
MPSLRWLLCAALLQLVWGFVVENEVAPLDTSLDFVDDDTNSTCNVTAADEPLLRYFFDVQCVEDLPLKGVDCPLGSLVEFFGQLSSGVSFWGALQSWALIITCISAMPPPLAIRARWRTCWNPFW